MNRPKMDSYDLSTKYTMCEFIRDLEKYCNELEQSNKSLSNAYDDCLATLHFWEEEYHIYRKALDKACEALEFVENSRNCESTVCSECKYCDAKYCIANRKNDWKEWLLKDE